MKKSNLKNLSLMLTLPVLLSASFTGCSKNNSKDTSNGEADTKNTTPVNLKVEVFDRGIQGNAPVDNNYMTKWINEKFGKPNNINVTFVPVSRAEESTKLNVLMAANEAPDICFTYGQDVANNYINQGGLTELGSYIQKYGKNLKSYLGDSVLAYGKISGKQYLIPAKRIFTGITASHVRQDWLDKLGLKAPTTTDEFYNVLKQFKEKDPGNQGANNIPFGMSMVQMNRGDFNLLYSFRKKMSDEDLATIPLWSQAGIKDGYKFLNKLYNEGLVSKDFALDKDGKKLNADISNGKVGFYIANVGASYQANPGIVPSLVKNIPTAKVVPCDPFTNSEGKHPKFTNAPLGMYIMVPKFSQRAAEAVKYLNWMSDSKVLLTLQNGIEGTQYEMKDGIPTPKTGTYEKVYNADYALVANGRELGSVDKTMKADAAACVGYEDMYVKSAQLSLVDPVIPAWFDQPNNSNIKYSATLSSKSDDMVVKLITAKPSDFDKLYDQLVDDYMKNGGTEVMNEAKKIYEAMKKK